MALKTSYSGPSYQASWALSLGDAFTVNGSLVIDGVTLPKLTHGQVVALAAAWKRAAARSREPSWSAWYDLTIGGLGWRAAGDKFVMTRAHAQSPAPAALVEYFWAATKDLAARLDAGQTKLAPLIVSYTWDGYEQAARDAWQQMKLERGLPPATPAPIESTDEAKPAESSGWGGAALLVVLLLAAGAKRTKRR